MCSCASAGRPSGPGSEDSRSRDPAHRRHPDRHRLCRLVRAAAALSAERGLVVVGQHLPLVWKLLPAAGLIFATGLIDDLIGLEVLAEAAGPGGGGALRLLRRRAGADDRRPSGRDWWSLPLTVLWLVGCDQRLQPDRRSGRLGHRPRPVRHRHHCYRGPAARQPAAGAGHAHRWPARCSASCATTSTPLPFFWATRAACWSDSCWAATACSGARNRRPCWA